MAYCCGTARPSVDGGNGALAEFASRPRCSRIMRATRPLHATFLLKPLGLPVPERQCSKIQTGFSPISSVYERGTFVSPGRNHFESSYVKFHFFIVEESQDAIRTIRDSGTQELCFSLGSQIQHPTTLSSWMGLHPRAELFL